MREIARGQKHGVTIAEIEALFSEPLLIVPGCNAFEIRDSDSGARQDQRGPNDFFGVYDTAKGWSTSGSADERALYACEGGRFL